jgi:hypothetical protein
MDPAVLLGTRLFPDMLWQAQRADNPRRSQRGGMALAALNVPHDRGGAQATVEFLAKAVPA